MIRANTITAMRPGTKRFQGILWLPVCRSGIPGRLLYSRCPAAGGSRQQPLSALHLGVHGSQRRETGRCIEVEHQVGKSRYLCQAHDGCHFISGFPPAPAHLYRSDLSRRKTTASVPTTFSLAINPVTAAAASCHTPNPNGNEQDGNGVCDAGQDGSIFRAFCNHLELPVEVCMMLYYRVAHKDDGSGLDNVCLAPFQAWRCMPVSGWGAYIPEAQ